MEIRQEREADYPAVYQVVKEAFAGAEHTDGHEQDLVAKLRQSPAFIPELSLVAVAAGQIVGHILFSRAFVGEQEVLALAPLAVLPEFQGRGIGLVLIAEGHRRAAALGYKYAVVLGHPGYYPQAGYKPASRLGISAPLPVAEECFMAICLNGEAGRLNGCIRYDRAFGI